MKNLICLSVTLILCSVGSATFALRDELKMKAGTPMDIHFVPLNTMTHLITKRDTNDGMLKAKEIQAKLLRTEKLKANRIRADRIKSDSIISDTIIVTAKRMKSNSEPERSSFDNTQRSSRRRERPRERGRSLGAPPPQDRRNERDRTMEARSLDNRQVLDLRRYKQPVKIDIHLPDSNSYNTMRSTRTESGRAPRTESGRAPWTESGRAPRTESGRAPLTESFGSPRTESMGASRREEGGSRSRTRSRGNRRRINEIQHDTYTNDLQSGLVKDRRMVFDAVQNVPNEPNRKRKRKSRRDRTKDRELIGFKQEAMPIYRRFNDAHGRELVGANTHGHVNVQELGTNPIHGQPSRGESGVLRARAISAGSIKTRLMNADSVTADHIRGERVNARTLNIQEQIPVEMSYFMNSPAKMSTDLGNNLYEKNNLISSQNDFLATTGTTVSPFNPKFGADTIPQESVFSRSKINPFVQSKAARIEKLPNLELLGISSLRLSQPEFKMIVETPVRKQRINFRDRYNSGRPSTVSRKATHAQTNIDRYAPRDIQSGFIAPKGSPSEYITDNYTKLDNSIKDFVMLKK